MEGNLVFPVTFKPRAASKNPNDNNENDRVEPHAHTHKPLHLDEVLDP